MPRDRKLRHLDGAHEAAAESVVDGILADAAGGHAHDRLAMYAIARDRELLVAAPWDDLLHHDLVGVDEDARRALVLTAELVQGPRGQSFEPEGVLQMHGDGRLDDDRILDRQRMEIVERLRIPRARSGHPHGRRHGMRQAFVTGPPEHAPILCRQPEDGGELRAVTGHQLDDLILHRDEHPAARALPFARSRAKTARDVDRLAPPATEIAW